MARKGSNVLSKPLFGVIALALVIFAIVFLYVKLASISNPCWQEVLLGLEPLKTGTSMPVVMKFDGECLSKFVITTNRAACGIECRSIGDDDEERACASKCSYGDDESPRTFIIAVPKDSGFFEKAGKVIYDRNLYWIMGGKTEVFSVGCQANSVDAALGCEDEHGVWACEPGENAASYTLAIDDTQKICDIKVKA
ncbi:MAG: hypothetical protein V1813_03595 [Candidatus Aenigmatarchaeota archaeon]